MADDLDDVIGAFESIASLDKRKRIERKALRAVAEIVQPALTAATPVSGGQAGSYGPLPPGSLRDAVKSSIRVDPDERGSSVSVGFGKLGHIARFVDEGHNNPTAKRKGKKSFTPAHPFIRAVEESTAGAATEAFVGTMTAEIEKELTARRV